MTLSSTLTLAPGLSREFLLHHGICPRTIEPDGTVVVAISPDGAADAVDDVAYAYRAHARAEAASRADVELLIERLVRGSESTIELERAGNERDDLTTDVRDLANQPPVIRYVNVLVREAFDASASDIHLDAGAGGLRVRFRLDGVLVRAPEPPREHEHAVVSRIKLLAELDIAERRRPQDGRIRVRLETRELDLRVSTVPTMYGESLVLRLLDRGGRPVELSELGMGAEVLDSFARLAERPHGMLLVTGPTGSGKTTTLYAALQRRKVSSEKIITVEDPVEYQLPGITQVPVNAKAGVTFGSALRSILRQDPDVLMVGEMRDQETGEIAVQAAMTGHLVFSTLHTNDAVGAVPRLVDLGVPAYLVAATLEAVLAQRLVRRVCETCREEYQPRAEAVALLLHRPVGRTRLIRGAGCDACRGTGYRGRVGLFELMCVDDDIRDAITKGASRARLRDLAIAGGMVPLATDGWIKIEAGLTTIEEVLRVVQQ